MTTINLRKASAIQREIIIMISELKLGDRALENSVVLNTYEEPGELVTKQRNIFIAEMQKVVNLTNILYNIRERVGTANSTSGISGKLADVERYKSLVSLFKVRTEQSVLSVSAIEGKLQQIRNNSANNAGSTFYQRETEFTTPVLTEEYVTAYQNEVKKFKKHIRELNEEILSLNISTTISLTDEEVGILEDSGLM